MKKNEYRVIVRKVKTEFDHIFSMGAFDGITKLISQYYADHKNDFSSIQILVLSELIDSSKKRTGEVVPLCSLATTRKLDNNYTGVSFGISPELKNIVVKIKGFRKRKSIQKLP